MAGSSLTPVLPGEVLIWGALGQVLLTRDAIELNGSKVIAVFADDDRHKAPFQDVPLYYGWPQFESWIQDKDPTRIGFSLSINRDGRGRLAYHERLTARGLKPVTLIHPSAVIARDAEIGEGSQIMAGVVIGPRAKIGKQCIVNVRAGIDHETVLEDGVEISPGATLCGLIRVGTCSWIAAGATVLPMIRIGENAVVGAGSVVNKDVPAGTTVVGIPARQK
jgi:sugar O-acyltransferase (sialic acid O-acetyltransferase NeuD family)